MAATPADVRAILEQHGGQVAVLDAPNADELLAELAALQYPGGVKAYLANARRLIDASTAGKSPFDAAVGIEPPPRLLRLRGVPTAAAAVAEAAAAGLTTAAAPKTAEGGDADADALRRAAFVIVAGGMGERLGFGGIKLALPVHTACPAAIGPSYLQHYCTWLRCAAGPDAPLVVMTSDETHQKTAHALEAGGGFGLTDVSLVKQSAVPAIASPACDIVVKQADAGGGGQRIVYKPSGHGDVHFALQQAGLPERWRAAGREFVCFLQDTNAAATLTVAPTIAAMRAMGWDMVLTCVPRVPGEAVGALAEVASRADGGATVRRSHNVEYNVLDDALRALGGSDAGAPVFSRFPGSINTLVLALPAYCAALAASGGSVPDVVVPKYTDASRTAFKKPTRLERLMQDVALQLPATAAVGGIVFDRCLYEPVKNNIVDAPAKIKGGIPPHCGGTGEAGALRAMRMCLRAAGVAVPAPLKYGAVSAEDAKREAEALAEEDAAFGEPPAGCHVAWPPSACLALPPDVRVGPGGCVPLRLFPLVAFDGGFAATPAQLRQRFPTPGKVRITRRSSLVLRGAVTIEALDLDGAVEIVAAAGASLRVVSLEARTAPWGARPLTDAEAAADEPLAVRGFTFDGRSETRRFVAEGGAFVLEGGEMRKA